MSANSNMLFDWLASVSNNSAEKNKRPPIRGFVPVPEEDWEAVTLINPSKDGPWICGGAVIRWFEGTHVGAADIDVFCRDEEQFKAVEAEISAYAETSVRVISTPNAITYKVASAHNKVKEWKIQIIRRTFYDSIEDVIGAFDVSACQIGTDGVQYYHTNQAVNDIRHKVLRIDDMKPGVVKRYLKYLAYGYKPVPGLHKAIVSDLLTTWDFEHSDDYDDV